MATGTKQQQSRSTYVDEQRHYIEFINGISKKAYQLGFALDFIRSLRRLARSTEFAQRLASVANPESELSFSQDVMFFEGKGWFDDATLRHILFKPPFQTELVKHLAERTKHRLRTRNQRITVFVSAEVLAGCRLPVEIIEEYPAFCLVSASEESAAELRKRFPVGFDELSDTMVPSISLAPIGGQAEPRNMMNYSIVYFGLPIRDELKKRLEAAGATIIRPKGSSALIIQASAEAIKQISDFREVTEVEPFGPALRIRSESIRDLGRSANAESIFPWAQTDLESSSPSRRGSVLPGVFLASFFTKEDSDNAVNKLSQEGIDVLDRPSATKLVLNITETDDALRDLLKIIDLAGLRLLEEETIETPSNDVARMIVGTCVVSPQVPSQRLPLTGQGEIIAIVDSGLDTGHNPTLHLDFKDRLRTIKSYPIRPSLTPFVHNPEDDQGPADLLSGHGTHVAGSAVGNGAQAVALGMPPIQGMAPEAELVFQAVEQTAKVNQQRLHEKFPQAVIEPNGLHGIPDDLTPLFEFAYENGARVHSNSWGSATKKGEYTSKCETLDEFVWEHKDFLVIVAAGNEGVQKGASIEPMSVIPPGTAKNCLTVGASENNRPGQFSDTYGDWWPKKFMERPFNSKAMVDSIDHIVPFSGRGPSAPAGRRKPDIVAPGTFVLSTRSSQMPSNNFAWGAFPAAKNYYMYMGGTSMAAPLVAGSAALVRQYLRTERGMSNPSAALMKAALIHSAIYMSCPNRHPTSGPWSDNEQGWGRLNLENVLAPVAPKQVVFIDETIALGLGEKRDYTVRILDPSAPLKVTLVYTDFPADAPGDALIHNLNLQLFDPDGNYYLGNDFDGSQNPDNVNNVEGVIVQPTARGEWKITVVARSVSMGLQDYALVVSGGGAILI